MNQTEFFSNRYKRALKKASEAIGAGNLDRAEAYARAARHYNFSTAVSAGKAMAMDEVLEILNCELEALSYGEQWEDAQYRMGLLRAITLVLKHKEGLGHEYR